MEQLVQFQSGTRAIQGFLVATGLFIFALRNSGRLTKERWFLGALICFGAALRLTTLHDFAINPDEAMFVQTAAIPDLKGLWETSLYHAHPPGSYLVYHYMMVISDHVTWLRLPSFLSGLYLIIPAFYLGRRLLGEGGAVMFAVFVCFSPALIELSSVCRNYTMMFAFLLTGLWMFVRYLEQGQRRDLLLFSLCFFCTLFYLYSAVVPFTGLYIWWGVKWLVESRKPKELIVIILTALPFGLMAILMYTLHVKPFSDMRAGSYATSWMEAQFDASPVRFISNTVDLYQYQFSEALGQVFAVMGFLGLFELIRKRSWNVLAFLVLPFAIAYLLQTIQKLPYGGTRHTTYLFPYSMALAGYGLRGFVPAVSQMLSRWKELNLQRTNRFFVLLLLSVYAIIASIQEFTLSERQELPVRLNELRQAVEILQLEAYPDDIVVLDEQSSLVLSCHFDELSEWYWNTEPVRFEGKQVDYYYIPHTRWYFKPAQFIYAAEQSVEAFELSDVRKVWTIHAGWEEQKKLRQMIREEVDGYTVERTGFQETSLPGSRQLLFLEDYDLLVEKKDLFGDPTY